MFTNLLEVLALELSNELLEALGLSVNADGGEDSLDVSNGGRLVAGKGKEHVGGDVLHFDGTIRKFEINKFGPLKSLYCANRVGKCRRVEFEGSISGYSRFLLEQEKQSI